MVTDSVSDLIIRIKNAGMVGKDIVKIPHSNLKLNVVKKLRVNNFVEDIKEEGSGPTKSIVIKLLYDKKGNHKVRDVERVSKPGRRVYSGVSNIHPIRVGKGLLILSTPKGILTGEEAKKEHVGGEVLFKIW